MNKLKLVTITLKKVLVNNVLITVQTVYILELNVFFVSLVTILELMVSVIPVQITAKLVPLLLINSTKNMVTVQNVILLLSMNLLIFLKMVHVVIVQ
jgi:hypothetical protein